MKKIDYFFASGILLGMTGSVLGGLNPMSCAIASCTIGTIYVTARLAYTAVHIITKQRELLAEKNRRLAEIAEERSRQNSWKNIDLKAMTRNDSNTLDRR